jgi:uncharacterized protein YbaP (TraB family)
MKKNLVTLVIVFALITQVFFIGSVAAKSSVWKVSKGNDYVYIAGTIHILPPSEYPLPKAFNQAYKETSSLVLETKLPDESDMALQVQMMQAMMYKNGQNLKSVLSKRTYKQLQEYVTGLGADLTMFELFKPGALVSVLAMLEAQKAQLSGEGVDMYFNKKAVADNKSVAYFETVEFQMNMLANMGRGHEDKFINSNLKQMANFKPMFIKLIDAWRRGDTPELTRLAIKPMQDDPQTLKTLLTDRNRNWIPHIERMFTDTSNNSEKEFVLVGIAHLLGNNNVLTLLKNRGYRIQQL